MSNPPAVAMPTTPVRWQVDILVRGNPLLSQESAFRAWISARGGRLIRVAEGHEDIVWYAQFASLGANALFVYDWVVRRLRALLPGDRINAIKVGVKRVTT
jgi:hypothetical protein